MSGAVLDTSVLIDLDDPELAAALPALDLSVTTITLAELEVGLLKAPSSLELELRRRRLELVAAQFQVLPFDEAAARSYGLVVAAVFDIGRSHRGRGVDLLIASIAHANGFDLITRNPVDFAGADRLLRVHSV